MKSPQNGQTAPNAGVYETHDRQRDGAYGWRGRRSGRRVADDR